MVSCADIAMLNCWGRCARWSQTSSPPTSRWCSSGNRQPPVEKFVASSNHVKTNLSSLLIICKLLSYCNVIGSRVAKHDWSGVWHIWRHSTHVWANGPQCDHTPGSKSGQARSWSALWSLSSPACFKPAYRIVGIVVHVVIRSTEEISFPVFVLEGCIYCDGTTKRLVPVRQRFRITVIWRHLNMTGEAIILITCKTPSLLYCS